MHHQSTAGPLPFSAAKLDGYMEQAGIEPVLIAAANTPDRTLERIARLSKAYTYCVSRAGITGTHTGGSFDAGLVQRLTKFGAPPPIFGFGISKPRYYLEQLCLRVAKISGDFRHPIIV